MNLVISTYFIAYFSVTMQYQSSQIPIAAKPIPQQAQPINLTTALNQPLGATAVTLPTAQQAVGATALNQPTVGTTAVTLPAGQLVIQGGTTLQVRPGSVRIHYLWVICIRHPFVVFRLSNLQ